MATREQRDSSRGILDNNLPVTTAEGDLLCHASCDCLLSCPVVPDVGARSGQRQSISVLSFGSTVPLYKQERALRESEFCQGVSLQSHRSCKQSITMAASPKLFFVLVFIALTSLCASAPVSDVAELQSSPDVSADEGTALIAPHAEKFIPFDEETALIEPKSRFLKKAFKKAKKAVKSVTKKGKKAVTKVVGKVSKVVKKVSKIKRKAKKIKRKIKGAIGKVKRGVRKTKRGIRKIRRGVRKAGRKIRKGKKKFKRAVSKVRRGAKKLSKAGLCAYLAVNNPDALPVAGCLNR